MVYGCWLVGSGVQGFVSMFVVRQFNIKKIALPEHIEGISAGCGLPVERNAGPLLDKGGVLGDDVGPVEDALYMCKRRNEEGREGHCRDIKHRATRANCPQ